MSLEECIREVKADYPAHLSQRVFKQYDKERRKANVRPESAFPKYYKFRTHTKNHWWILASKSPSVPKYKGEDTVVQSLYTYYTGAKGLMVFKALRLEDLTISVSAYKGHVFTRYNERMGLDLKNPLDKVAHFFVNNEYEVYHSFEDNSMVAAVTNGFLLGIQVGDTYYARTFISHKEAREGQMNIRDKMIKSLESQLHYIKKQVNATREDYYQVNDALVRLKAI